MKINCCPSFDSALVKQPRDMGGYRCIKKVGGVLAGLPRMVKEAPGEIPAHLLTPKFKFSIVP